MPPGVGIFEFLKPALCGHGVMRDPPTVVEDQHAGDAVATLLLRGLRADHRCFETATQVRGDSPEEPDLASLEVRATPFAPYVNGAPEFFARGKDPAQLVAVSKRLHKLPVAQGALKPAIGCLGEQCHWAPTLCHRVVLVDVVCEVEVLPEKACLLLASHLFLNGVSDQPAKRVYCMGAVSFEWHGTPQAVGYLAQQRRLVEPSVAKPFHLTEDPISCSSTDRHHSTPPRERHLRTS